jgi:hypothetical protein
MSAPLVVSIPHRLGKDEAVRRLKNGLTRAATSVPVLKVDEERWDGDQMAFRVRALGQAASGRIDVGEFASKWCCPGCCSASRKRLKQPFVTAGNCC